MKYTVVIECVDKGWMHFSFTGACPEYYTFTGTASDIAHQMCNKKVLVQYNELTILINGKQYREYDTTIFTVLSVLDDDLARSVVDHLRVIDYLRRMEKRK